MNDSASEKTREATDSIDRNDSDQPLHFFDAKQEEYSDSDGQYAELAAASALVGESVVSSPEAGPKSTSSSNLPPALHVPSMSADEGQVVGLVAQGFAWVRNQRDRRRRLYLQLQAEQQLQIICSAQAAEKAKENTLAENPTFQTLTQVENKPTESESVDESLLKAANVSQSGDGYSVEFSVACSEEDDAEWIPRVRVEKEPGLNSNPFILNKDQMQQIAVHVLPRGIAYARWKRLYSLARDGDSFDACLRYVQGHARTLLVVRTSRSEILGGFADSPWEPPTVGGARFYGGATASLFRVDPETRKVLYYKWTGTNRYIQLCDVNNRMLAFGGGGDDGAFGLCVEQDFQRGSTGTCATFENEPLCSQENFEIVDMEIFGFLVGQF